MWLVTIRLRLKKHRSKKNFNFEVGGKTLYEYHLSWNPESKFGPLNV